MSRQAPPVKLPPQRKPYSPRDNREKSIKNGEHVLLYLSLQVTCFRDLILRTLIKQMEIYLIPQLKLSILQLVTQIIKTN